jgi:hypothetical protein
MKHAWLGQGMGRHIKLLRKFHSLPVFFDGGAVPLLSYSSLKERSRKQFARLLWLPTVIHIIVDECSAVSHIVKSSADMALITWKRMRLSMAVAKTSGISLLITANNRIPNSEQSLYRGQSARKTQ